jgi:hypothetical protein
MKGSVFRSRVAASSETKAPGDRGKPRRVSAFPPPGRHGQGSCLDPNADEDLSLHLAALLRSKALK